jgi:hypothetical protein
VIYLTRGTKESENSYTAMLLMNWLTNPPLSENEQTDDLNLRTVLNLASLSKGSSING